jgi:two-component system NtrC family response regulator
MQKATSDAPANSGIPTVGKTKLLIVEDDESVRIQMRWALVETTRSFSRKTERMPFKFRRERLSVVTLDLGLPPRPRDLVEDFPARRHPR